MAKSLMKRKNLVSNPITTSDHLPPESAFTAKPTFSCFLTLLELHSTFICKTTLRSLDLMIIP